MIIEETEPDISVEPAMLRELTEDQRTRLTEQLDEYLRGMEQGAAVDVGEIARQNPDLADVFKVYLSKLQAIYGIAVGFDAGDARGLSAFTQRLSDGCSAEQNRFDINGPMKLGDFTILHELGRGGMGVVYEANQQSLNRRVAIKLLSVSSAIDANQIARFRNEAHAAGLLQHPNIVAVHSVGSDRGIHYYAMQLIEGQSMDAWVRNRGDAPPKDGSVAWSQVVRWCVDIADALHCAHATGVVHRDVKPSNLMLDGSGKIWITDFGLARCQSDQSLTKPGDLVGTMRYMSPEQSSGQSALVDGRTDIYSLAATAYEMLALRPAHPGDETATILRSIDQHNVTPLRQHCPSIPRDLETVVAKAMSKHRDQRYETAADFRDDLRRVLAGEPTIARPASIIDKVANWAIKHQRSVLVSVLVIMLVATLGFVGLAVGTAVITAEKRASVQHAIAAARGEKLARDAVDRLGAQMAELLSEIPAAESVRRRLLSETLDYYQQFAFHADDDPDLQEDLAITFGKIGGLQSELGAGDEAVDSYQKSESLYSRLAEPLPSRLRLQLDWSTSQNNLAESLHRSGRIDDAAVWFAEAIQKQTDLLRTVNEVNDDSLHDTVVMRLSTSLNNLGLLLSEAGALEEAEASYRRAIALLASGNDNDSSAAQRQQLASVQVNLGGLLTRSDPARAAEYAREALVIQADSLSSNPGNARLATQVVVTLNTLGAAQLEAEQLSAAVNSLERAAEIGKQLLQRWPDQMTYRRDFVISLNQLGLALSKSGKLNLATARFEEAVEQGRTLAEQFPEDAEIQSMLGGVLNNFGFLHQQLGDDRTAMEAYEEAVRVQTHAVQLAPEVARYRAYLLKHQDNLRSFRRIGNSVRVSVSERLRSDGDGSHQVQVSKEDRS
ncbi:serine/threonine protein kinase [Novipirellula artificiosorum]|uniref:Serine/threonine-protein kinase PrkC n=1 Tax=Novipirellula artificiosorum TaxID=2528016 RepID=A0A5C6D123_9BACT|nr:protein kinase [Novipirellula artificiosorum]TWU30853.1 Serine/threonine-protein kinase PrkC [Novipirellula artificiosorum]